MVATTPNSSKSDVADAIAKAEQLKNGNKEDSDKTIGVFEGKKETKSENFSGFFSYPISRSPQEETGDTLLIKCLEYIPPENSDPTGGIFIDGVFEVDASENIKANSIVSGNDGIKKRLRSKVVTDKNGNDKRVLDLKDPKIYSNFKQANQRMLENSKIKYYVELPIPQEVNDSNQVVWGEDTLNALEIAGLAVGQAALQSKDIGESVVTTAQTALAALQTGVSFGRDGNALSGNVQDAIRASISGAAINALGSNVSQKSILSRSTGQILNSNLELLFQGMSLRSFPFSVTFTPRDPEETKVVKAIIRSLKQSMAPKASQFNGSSATGLFLKSPDLFSLKYRHGGGDHPFLNAFKICALTGMQVNYTNAGTYASYADGTPVSIRLNMTFKEINPIYNEDYETAEAGIGVGY